MGPGDQVAGSRDPTTLEDKPRFVIGIGASAGGLEPLEEFFATVPTDTQMAFVVIQHLSPDYESRMDELLSRQTRLPVENAQHGQVLRPNRVYLGVARTEMIVSGGRLLLAERNSEEIFALPIDHFFRSLAQEYGERSIGIILSGTGSDGSRGTKEIHSAQGLTLVETPNHARFDGMPKSALETGAVDLVLEPSQMLRAIIEHAKLDTSPLAANLVQDEQQLSPLDNILNLLHAECHIDFNDYKPGTVMRRIQRRRQLSENRGIEDYAAFLAENNAELNELYKDLLIGVTQFFRDPDAYEKLSSEVIDPLVQKSGGADLRVWVAGCATGEEAYSIAILFHEASERHEVGCRVKVFATDVHANSLEFANQGRYSEQALEGVNERRRERFFVQEDETTWRVSKQLRTSVVFANHNVLTDAPFTRLDMVSCRNMLIYLQPAAQKRVLTLFHFSLKTGGVLFLGSSETPGALGEEFEAVQGAEKTFRKKRDVRLSPDPRVRRAPSPLVSTRERERARPRVEENLSQRQLVSLYARILDEEMRSSLLLDERYQLLHTFGGAERFLKVPAGRVTSNALELVDPNLRTPLSGALQQAQKQRQRVDYSGLRIETRSGEVVQASLAVKPHFDEMAGAAFLVQVTTVDVPQEAKDAPQNVEEASIDYVRSLEDELRFARENLQATIEELETSNEELQATNEELMASNEELQSTNEELHSVNEELYTVNTEHQEQIKELTQLTDDLDNLFKNIDAGVLFLDGERKIRKFTKVMARLLRLEPGDVGRSVDDFARNLDDVDLAAALTKVAERGERVEHEVNVTSGPICVMRIAPYKSAGETDGTIVTLFDITRLKQSMAAFQRLSAVVAHSPDAIISVSVDGEVTSWNHGAEELFGVVSKDAVGRTLEQLAPEEGQLQFDSMARRAMGGEAVAPYETVRVHPLGRQLHLSEALSPLFGERDNLLGIGVIVRDITRLKRAEEQVRRAVIQRDQFIAILSHELRNPMMGIQAALDLLSRHHGDEGPHGVLVRQVTQMSRILDDLLDVTRMRRDKLEMRRSNSSLLTIIREVLQAMEPRIAEAGVEFRTDLPERDDSIAHVDPARIQQLLVNLLGNALKFTKTGKRVKLSMSRVGQEAKIAVTDDGAGISRDELESIFDPFSQSVDAPVRDRNAGMGLGLALSRAIARAHGGDVVAASAGRGLGSSFVVTLPLVSDEEAQASLPPSSQEPTFEAGRKKLLIVEDDQDNRELLEMLLAEEGHEVVGCGNGAKAVELLMAGQFDAALVDLGIPEKDGLQVAREVRRSNRQVKLVALTGHGTQQDRANVDAAGFDEHLVKPVSVDVLQRVLGD